ncbi:DNA-3-methyladenine glycosylase I [bacterium]|nr:DNA-3-methyladenine glycosylase I [bacterium]
MVKRCAWCGDDPLYCAYHDTEWGVPEWDGRALWEKLVLDGFQAGLSWITILKKRDNFRAVFQGFDPERIARWDETDIQRALADPGIIRHRGKIEATVKNARAYLALQEKADFATLLWDHVGGAPRQNRRASGGDIPAESAESVAMSKMLKKAGFSFVGPTIVYAFMQACGLVNDHLVTCDAHDRVAALAHRP